MNDDDRATRPATVGELRRRLERMGRPWSVPARFGDDDPLPDPPRGGQPVEPGHVAGLRPVDSPEEFEAVLREVYPVNPYLVARWRDLGVAVPDADDAAAAGEGDVPECGVG
jgi:hypothetical protein